MPSSITLKIQIFMLKLKIKTALAIVLLPIFSANAQQVPLKSVVEHFTNTKCSVCASNNPSFFTNYNTTSNILYLSVHPSSPYSSCFLSLQNKTINDARTNYYGIYGGTPLLVINGSVYSGSFSNSNMFAPYQNLNSSFKLSTNIQLLNDTFIVSTTIKKVDTSVAITANLFVGLIEDTINQDGGNGESKHYNVLRNANSISVNLPLNINDSVTNVRKFSKANFWQLNRINSIVLLQNSVNKKLIQAETSKQVEKNTSSLNSIKFYNLKFHPNPASSVVYFNHLKPDNYQYQIVSTEGKIMKSGNLNGSELSISELKNGTYIIRIFNNQNSYQSLVLVQH